MHVDCSWKRLSVGEPVPEVVSRLYQPRNVLERDPWWYKTPPWKQASAGVLGAGHRRSAPKLPGSSSKPSLVPRTPEHRAAPTRSADLKRSASAPHELARAGVPLQVVQGRLVVVENFVGRKKAQSTKSPLSKRAAPTLTPSSAGAASPTNPSPTAAAAAPAAALDGPPAAAPAAKDST